jgi:archaellum component FlaF (FlaF/FlaG flagellin family)
MSINSGDRIIAADYNTLQSRVEQILGTGSQSFGYGQQVESSQVSGPSETGATDASDVTAEELNNLRSDIGRIYTHQTGLSNPVEEFVSTDVIGADQTAKEVTVDDDNNYSYNDIDETKGFNNLVEIVNELESDSNRFNINPNQQGIVFLSSDRRTLSWNGNIQSEFQLSFSDSDQRRYFFNAGGQIRINGTVTNASTQRGTFWNDLIENPGEIQFGYNYTQNTGSSNGVSFPGGKKGNADLTSLYQTIFRKDASSGLYSDSYWEIQAKEISDSKISFRVILVNDGPESDTDSGVSGAISGGVKESVEADIEFDYDARRADGTVVTEFPNIQISDRFE